MPVKSPPRERPLLLMFLSEYENGAGKAAVPDWVRTWDCRFPCASAKPTLPLNLKSMSKTLIALVGQDEDLTALASLKSTDWMVRKEDGEYYLTSQLLDTARDADDALHFAHELMPVINGSAQIFMPHFEPVRLAGHAIIVLATGAKQTARHQTGKARIRHAVSAAEIQNCPP